MATTTTNTDQQVTQGETLDQIADRIAYKYLDRTVGSAKLKSDILSALRNERERCAKVADERAAFNRRLAATHKIGDPMADLKHTRADEDEVVANEIREGR